MSLTELGKRIEEEMEKVLLVDTHEHIRPEAERLGEKIDFFYLFPHYASSDLVSAGMSQEVLEEIRDTGRPLQERWEKFYPHWENIRNTAYARALILAARDLFGVDEINEKTWGDLSEKISASNKAGWYRYVLKERAKIDVSVIDLPKEPGVDARTTDVDREFFIPVMRFDRFVSVGCCEELEELESDTRTSIHSLDDLLKALDVDFEKNVKAGIVGVKTGLAYRRIIKYDKVTKGEAEAVFNKIFSPVKLIDRNVDRRISWEEAKPFQDFMMHQIIKRALQYKLPVQVHTGLQEGNGNMITNSNPTHLLNLFLEYKDVKFDIFHGGYPYSSELAVLGKNFPNVFVDMCWLHIISPSVAKRVLHEWIETVPGNKIFGFGGDYRFVEGAYAHSRMARKVVSQVLTEKVQDGYLSEEEAISLGEKILRGNAKNFFSIK